MLKDYQKILLELLEQLELEISYLYKFFAEKFPSHSKLWNSLLEEETNHASYVKKLSSLAKKGEISFDEKTTKTYTLKTVINYIKAQYQKAETDQFTLVNALSFSLNLEQSLIEKKFYDYFSSNDREVIMIINKIKEEILEHKSRIEKSL